MNKDFKQILPQIIEIRRHLHQYPEIKHEEIETAALIAETLKSYGYQVKTNIGTTGVSAILDSGKPGKTVALRADMDALLIDEATNLAYKSKYPGKMHACGHDGHTATLLAAAAVLKNQTNRFSGKIKFIFQPAEEDGSGALAMIKAGILENPKVDAIFAFHNGPNIPAGVIATRTGPIMAANNNFIITLHGRGGHAGTPSYTIDPIYVGTLLVQHIQGIVSRHTLASSPRAISVTFFNAGFLDAINVIPDIALLGGSIRTADPELQNDIKNKLTQLVQDISQSCGAKVNIEFHKIAFPVTINTAKEKELVINTATQCFGKDKVKDLSEPIMAAEDFSRYLETIPGCFFFVGNGLNSAPAHSPHYDFNDEIIPVAAEMLTMVAIGYLNSSSS